MSSSLLVEFVGCWKLGMSGLSVVESLAVRNVEFVCWLSVSFVGR